MENPLFESPRLRFRPIAVEDAEFIFELMNDDQFIRFIGDRELDSVEKAADYLRNHRIVDYEREGYGLYLVTLKECGSKIGITSLRKRESLSALDIGFAFLTAYRGKGLAFEAAQATEAYARDSLKTDRLFAICSPDNERSIRLIQKLGMTFESKMQLPECGGVCSMVFAKELDASTK